MLASCVSGAQLSNYATFLTDPAMAPLSIVMTSLSTATAVIVTPLLSLLLIGKRLPVDVQGMISNILQIVVSPIAAGLLLNRYGDNRGDGKMGGLGSWVKGRSVLGLKLVSVSMRQVVLTRLHFCP